MKDRNLYFLSCRLVRVLLCSAFTHKAAFDFIFQDPKYFTHWTLAKLTELHGLLTDGLDNQWQIKEALNKFITLINSFSSGLDKALLCLSILAYIQVFEDGNKRTSRLAANACLLAENYLS